MAKDYNVTISFTIPITARNQDQAEERAGQLQDWIKLDSPKSKPWFGDMEVNDTQVEEA